MKPAKETRQERFVRVAEARTNKIIKMIRLLGNCSRTNIYAYGPKDVEKIFSALQAELDAARTRYDINNQAKRFSLTSDPSDDASCHPSKYIPATYKTKHFPNGGGVRTISPIGREIRNKKLEELACPCCWQVGHLRDGVFSGPSDEPLYAVVCDYCDFVSPTRLSADNGDAVGEFRDWLEAFELLGRPRDRLHEDLTRLFDDDDNGEDERS